MSTASASEIEYWIGTAYEAMGDSAKERSAWNNAAGMSAANAGGPGANGPMRSRANIGGLAAGVRVEQAEPYYQALALEKLGQDDRAKAIFAQLIATGSKSLDSETGMKGPAQAVATPAQRSQVADAHYLVGLGQLGLNNQEQGAAGVFTRARGQSRPLRRHACAQRQGALRREIRETTSKSWTAALSTSIREGHKTTDKFACAWLK